VIALDTPLSLKRPAPAPARHPPVYVYLCMMLFIPAAATAKKFYGIWSQVYIIRDMRDTMH
jgi:hypothetical protein